MNEKSELCNTCIHCNYCKADHSVVKGCMSHRSEYTISTKNGMTVNDLYLYAKIFGLDDFKIIVSSCDKNHFIIDVNFNAKTKEIVL